MRKRVLFVINTLGTAGAEIALLSLLKLLDPMKLEIELLVIMGQGELLPEFPEYVKVLNSQFDTTEIHSKEGMAVIKRNVRHALFHNANVFGNLCGMVRNFIIMLFKGKIWPDKLLWHVMSDAAQTVEGEYDLAVSFLEGASAYYVSERVNAKKKAAFVHIDYSGAGYSRKIDRGCYLKFDRIFAVSDEVKDSFLKIYPELSSKTKIFHNIFDKEHCWNNAAKPGGFEEEFDGLRILTVGRITYQKGYDIAVDAMRILKDRGLNVRWYAVGEGEQRSSIERAIARYGLQEDFILLGAKKNPFPYYLQCDIYAHITRFEGKSLAIQEAQTLACTIIASDVNGNREQIIHGQDGIICRLEAKEVADAIEMLANDDQQRIALGFAAGEKESDDISRLALLEELL